MSTHKDSLRVQHPDLTPPGQGGRHRRGTLIDEGLLVRIPFTGTHVIDLTVQAVREIYSLRTALEIFAFEVIWQRRDKSFRRELIRRHTSLSRAIEREDEIDCISSEFALHSLVYEASKHGLLLDAWNRLSGKLQIYWSAHHLAHQRRGPRRGSHDSFIEAALGPDLERMRDEIRSHMRLGAVATETFITERQSTPTAALSSVAPSSTSSTFGTIARRMPKI